MADDREDQTLTCVQCGTEFVFTADEQEFFESKGLASVPKRCKACRLERRKSRRPRGRKGGGPGRRGEYRGPAFHDEEARKVAYTAPAFRGQDPGDDVYRGPAFREREAAEAIYTAPAFRERDEIDQAVYTSPAFKAPDNPVMEEGILPATWRRRSDEDGESEAAPVALAAAEEHDLELGPPPSYREPTSPHEMYRAPAFAGTDPSAYGYRRKEMHEIVCAECGRKSRVPFKPQKDRPVYCKDCFQSKGRGGGKRR